MIEFLKTMIKNNIPILVEPVRLLLHPSYFPSFLEKRKVVSMSSSDRFKYYYETGVWKNDESNSGPGSRISRTMNIRNSLPTIFKEFNIKSMLDIPCGDFHWMKHVDVSTVNYLGADVVESLIKNNKLKYQRQKFITLDLLKDNIPRYDLIFCRDCLVHFSFKDSLKAIENLKKSKSKFLLTTTYPSSKINHDIMTGDWRTIDLEKSPFNFPSPIKLIQEDVDHVGMKNKFIGLWKISDLP